MLRCTVSHVASVTELTPILTIGYGNRNIDEFVALLKQAGVSYLADVRSVPYSRRSPEYSRELLERRLRSENIRYIFLGNLLGGRPEDPACYDADGHVDYTRCRDSHAFQRGIDRIKTAYEQDAHLALMCSEARPSDCHRSKLLAEMLEERGVPVQHINERGDLVEHDSVAAELQGPQLSFLSDGLGRSRRAYRAAAG
jgi:uncharacterized protein (DUF488 family)